MRLFDRLYELDDLSLDLLRKDVRGNLEDLLLGLRHFPLQKDFPEKLLSVLLFYEPRFASSNDLEVEVKEGRLEVRAAMDFLRKVS